MGILHVRLARMLLSDDVAVGTEQGEGGEAAPPPLGLPRAVLRAFAPLGRALHEGAEPEDVLRIAAAEMAALVGVPRCLVHLRDEHADTFRGVVAHGAQEQRVRHLVSGLDADALTQEILRTGASVAVENARTDPRTVRSAMDAWDVHSVLGLPILDRGRVLGLFFLDVPGAQHRFDVAARDRAEAFAELTSVAFVQAQTAAQARGEQRHARAQAAALSRTLAVDDRLWGAVLDGFGERQVAQVLADLTGRSWAVYAPTCERIAAAAPGGGEHDPVVVPDLAAIGVFADPGVAAALRAVGDGRPVILGPFRELGLHRRLMFAGAGKGEGRRFVVAVEHDRRFGAADSLIAHRAATVFATQALERDRAVSFSRPARAAELAELLRGNVDASTLPRYLTALDLPADARTMVCVLSAAPRVVDPERVEAAMRAALAPDCSPIVTAVPAGTAVLLEVPSETDGVLVRLRTACRRLAGDDPLRVGVSAPVTGLEACPQAHDDAVDVLACIDTLAPTAAPGATVLAASELGCSRTLLAGVSPAGARRFVQRTLGTLLKPAAEPLLLTLAQLAANAWSIRAAAEALDVHENTIRYRVGRIEEVSGLAIRTDALAQMEARMALLVLDAQRRVAAV